MRTAFIGLDYIIDIMHPEGKIARCAEQAAERDIITKTNDALEIITQKGWLKILVKVGFSENYVEQPKHSPMFGKVNELGALRLDSKGTDFHPSLNTSDCLIVVKPRVSAFHGTNLDVVLRANKIERLLISGVSTAWAVQSTVRAAHDYDYQVCIIEDLCAAADRHEHQTSIDLMSRIAKVITVEDLKNF
ncbi:isochorismatase family cysteine hydrolase [Legionella taurinensis]|uniref:Isochorismatase family protein n=1 Tax=Legionella taurinensis TaxID=70611 RepID=A0A3A5L7U5_9GAMM|nr:isochorismatase family cysteine hydrolase [Legionella taurinensis]RJT49367.1 isochorismatase family protein [Legionella taurinensis]RJT69400.1 isochorismatase family protein [Legionella taurinensis]STY26734.1 isochorismatase [Legionella taurinensis]